MTVLGVKKIRDEAPKRQSNEFKGLICGDGAIGKVGGCVVPTGFERVLRVCRHACSTP